MNWVHFQMLLLSSIVCQPKKSKTINLDKIRRKHLHVSIKKRALTSTNRVSIAAIVKNIWILMLFNDQLQSETIKAKQQSMWLLSRFSRRNHWLGWEIRLGTARAWWLKNKHTRQSSKEYLLSLLKSLKYKPRTSALPKDPYRIL